LRGGSDGELRAVADAIRYQLNPNPGAQLTHNRARLNGRLLSGVQHKYPETVLYFPPQGQTCHSYCTFCFRWPQFVGIRELKLEQRDQQDFLDYLRIHPEVTDV